MKTPKVDTTTKVEVNRAALSAADLAFMETPGSNMTKVQAAVEAYLWAVRERKPWGASPDLFVYPSLNDWREYVANRSEASTEQEATP